MYIEREREPRGAGRYVSSSGRHRRKRARWWKMVGQAVFESHLLYHTDEEESLISC
jgi:hypothetical protein